MKRKDITIKEAQKVWKIIKDNEFTKIYFPNFNLYWEHCKTINNLSDEKWHKLVKENLEKITKCTPSKRSS